MLTDALPEPLPGKRPTRARLRVPGFLVRLRGRLPSVKLSLLEWHLVFFFVLYVVSALLVWGITAGGLAINFWESLFLVISAGTGAGLNNVGLHESCQHRRGSAHTKDNSSL